MGSSPTCATIEVDLKCTLPRMVMFADTSVRVSFGSILDAYANVDAQRGDVQGMVFHAAMLLSYLDEQRGFSCFCKLMCGK
jgi:hypothetical protein